MSIHDAPIHLKSLRVQRFAITDSDENQEDIEPNLRGFGWMRIKARGANVQVVPHKIADADSPPGLVFDATGADSTVGYTIENGHYEDFYMTDATRIAWAADGSGYVELLKTDEPSGKKMVDPE